MNLTPLKAVISCLLLLTVSEGFAQDRVCPRFVIKKEKGTKLENRLRLRYRAEINRYVDTVNAFLVLRKDYFKNMLIDMKSGDDNGDGVNGFRVFFALDGNVLKLIFTGLRDDVDTEDYYIINRDSTYTKVTNPSEIQRLSDQVTAYQRITRQYLNRRIDASHHGNTITYVFNQSMNDALIAELTRNADIFAVKFRLGAYYDDSMNPNSSPVEHNNYTDRIMLGFTFIAKDKSEIFLSELPVGNPNRCKIDTRAVQMIPSLLEKKALSPLEKKKLESKLTELFLAIGADTGTPCPPGTGCGTPSLPRQ